MDILRNGHRLIGYNWHFSEEKHTNKYLKYCESNFVLLSCEEHEFKKARITLQLINSININLYDYKNVIFFTLFGIRKHICTEENISKHFEVILFLITYNDYNYDIPSISLYQFIIYCCLFIQWISIYLCIY